MKTLLEGEAIVHGGKTDRGSRYIEPTLIEGKDDSALMDQEIFGPILPIISFKYIDEAIRRIKEKPYPLALYVFSTSKEVIERFIIEVPFGGGCINDTAMHLTNSNLPFGGIGKSGMGSYHGVYGFEAFSHRKSVLIQKNWFDMFLKYPPFSTFKFKIVKKLLS